MSGVNLFGGQTRTEYLVEFRAGKMTKIGNTVSPVKGRKGLVYLQRSQEDSLLHFCWKDRVTGQVEDDLIIFPNDADFVRVNQCTTGLVFVLKFRLNDRRLFYWSQEFKEDKDVDWMLNTFNVYMNTNQIPNTWVPLTGCLPPFADVLPIIEPKHLTPITGRVGGVQYFNLSPLFSSYYRQSLNDPPIRSVTEQMLVPSTESVDNNFNYDLGDIDEFDTMPALEYIEQLPPELEPQFNGLQDSGDCLTVPKDNQLLNVALSSAITMDLLQPILSNSGFLRKVRMFLPRIDDDIRGNVLMDRSTIIQQLAVSLESTFFKRDVITFASALQSGSLGGLMSKFGFGVQFGQKCMDAVQSGDLIGFMEELQKALFEDKNQTKDEK